MGVFVTSGTKIFIGPAMQDTDDDYVAADFSTLTYVEIKNTTSLGAFGDTAATVTSAEINRGRDRKAKGTRNAGDMQLTCNDNPADPGQVALYAAEASPQNYAFKIVLPDAPAAGTNPQGSTRYFAAKVMSTPENLGGPNNFATVTYALGIDSNIVRVAATAS